MTEVLKEAFEPFARLSVAVNACVHECADSSLRVVVFVSGCRVVKCQVSTAHGTHEAIRLILTAHQNDVLALFRMRGATPRSLSQWIGHSYVAPMLAVVPS